MQLKVLHNWMQLNNFPQGRRKPLIALLKANDLR